MDILQKYNEENPGASPQTFQCDPAGEYGALTCTIINLSGGRIQNVSQANRFLIGVAVIFFIIAGTLLFAGRQQSTFRYTPVPVGKNIQEVNWPPLQK